MTRDGTFKKVVRRHAEETGQRSTEALTDLEDLAARMHHEPSVELCAAIIETYVTPPRVIAASRSATAAEIVGRAARGG